jgi:hypothetical protein
MAAFSTVQAIQLYDLTWIVIGLAVGAGGPESGESESRIEANQFELMQTASV